MNNIRLAACGLIGAAAALPAQVPVAIVMTEPLAARALLPLAEACGAEGVVQVAPVEALATGGAATVLFGIDELQWWRLHRAGLLDATASAPAQTEPVLRWSLRYSLVLAESVARSATIASWQDVALSPVLHDRLGLCPPSVDPAPWLSSMEAVLATGQGETAGFALWTTLDARAGRYFDSYADILTGLRRGEVLAAVLPEPMLDRNERSQSGLIVAALAAGSPSVRLGLAVTAGKGAEAAWQLMHRLAGDPVAGHLGEQLGLRLLTDVSKTSAVEQAERWCRHFEERIAGQGRRIEGIADSLDLVFTIGFGVLVLIVLLVAWRRQRAIDRSSSNAATGPPSLHRPDSSP